MRLSRSGWLAATGMALRPAVAPWALRPAAAVIVAAAAVCAIGIPLGRPDLVAVCLFGTACAAVLADRTGTRAIYATSLLWQALGACAGIALGSLTHGPIGSVVLAGAVGAFSGPLGRLGRAGAGAGLMAIIGVAFAAFGGSALSWYQQCLCYLAGTAAIAVADLGPWPWRPRDVRRAAVVEVFRACAAVFESAGSRAAPTARSGLVAASQRARKVVFGPRLRWRRRPVPYEDVWRRAADAALQAAAATVDRQARPAEAAQMRIWADALQNGDRIDWPTAEPVDVAPPAELRARAVVGRGAWADGIRIGWCMALATAVTLLLHDPGHALWIPLTVSVLVRPEYGTVFVRVVNRLAGTLAGGALAAALLLVLGSGPPVAAAAAIAIGFSVAAAPKSYALSVIGVTCGALMSASIATADPVVPLIRVGDTLIGAAIAVVFGFVLWPGRGAPDPSQGLRAAVTASADYLRAVTTGTDVAAASEQAYTAAGNAIDLSRAALLEPPPVGALARRSLARSLAVKSIVDEITALRRHGGDSTAAVLRGRLANIENESTAGGE
ncbi:FUSC family protein [Gordonia sp. DT219]|uniref:FUSC family protein n=1 Tax=Gordonia sp. DT219 TaxID=3416658 RepID=UPI003CE9A9AF